ncbi:MAG TPA: twin-arginine translocase TatA/TatE family subunit [Candidatus Dormibacteraeota bacterium]|jgi:sec-independent protein translocase protein TatA
MPFINGGHIWLVLILLAVLVIFGPSKLPELGSAVGRSLREFRKATTDLKDEMNRNQDEPVAPAAASSTAPAPAAVAANERVA